MRQQSTGFTILLYAILLVIGIVMAFPFYWMLATSFKTLDAVYEYPPQFVPKLDWNVISVPAGSSLTKSSAAAIQSHLSDDFLKSGHKRSAINFAASS